MYLYINEEIKMNKLKFLYTIFLFILLIVGFFSLAGIPIVDIREPELFNKMGKARTLSSSHIASCKDPVVYSDANQSL